MQGKGILPFETRIITRDIGRKSDYNSYFRLYEAFRKEVGWKRANRALAERIIKRGREVIVLAVDNAKQKPIGFVRVDIENLPAGKGAKIGAIYIAPGFRHSELWKRLDKKAWTIAKMAGCKEIGSFIHTEAGEKITEWRKRNERDWIAPKTSLKDFLSVLRKEQKHKDNI